MNLLRSILESEKSKAVEQLVQSIGSEFGVNYETSQRIADWMINDRDDKEVDELLYNHYSERMPYSVKSEDPSDWIANTVTREFKKELDAIWKAGKQIK